MATRHLRNLLPIAFVEDAARLDVDTFLRHCGSAPLLLVRIPEDDAELRAGLQSLWLPAATQSTARVAPLQLGTDLLRGHPAGAPTTRGRSSEHGDVLVTLGEGVHVAVTLRRKGGRHAERLGARRVSLGRATNNDVVLRHKSVSKLHVWLEPTGEDTVTVVDAASTNGTLLNSATLQKRVAAEAQSGDRLRFGDVETLLWSPRALWASLHQS